MKKTHQFIAGILIAGVFSPAFATFHYLSLKNDVYSSSTIAAYTTKDKKISADVEKGRTGDRVNLTSKILFHPTTCKGLWHRCYIDIKGSVHGPIAELEMNRDGSDLRVDHTYLTYQVKIEKSGNLDTAVVTGG